MTVRVGVAGVAGMGLYHLITIPKIEGYELTAICDVVPDALERACGGAPNAKSFSDIGELCASGTVDALVIATPNALHAANVRSALEAGLHVYCEKPLGVTVRECREIAALARSVGRHVQVGFQHRFQHSYAGAKRIVDAGELGPLHRADLQATGWFRPDSYFKLRPWRARWAQAGGGVLMLQAIHQLDAFVWIAGMPSRVVARAWRTRAGVEVEDDLYAILEYPDAARGMLSASTVDPAGTNRIDVHGDLGALHAEGETLRVGRTDEPVSTMREERKNPFEPVNVAWTDVARDEGDALTFDECVTACHRDFVEAITTGRDPLNNAEEATRAVEVADAVYLSAVTEGPVDLPLDADAYDDAFARMCSGELTLPFREEARV